MKHLQLEFAGLNPPVLKLMAAITLLGPAPISVR
jgi:hypothetical protein